MRKSKFLFVLCMLLGASSVHASELAIVTDKNVVGNTLKVSVLNHPKYDYESIDLYQESIGGESTLLGNYLKGSLNNTLVPLNLAYKHSFIKGVVNNPTILNQGSEVYIKSNLPYYTIEGNPILWGYLFDGLGTPTGVKWTVTSYDEGNVKTGVQTYENSLPPSTLSAGTHIVKLEYSDMYGEKFENTKAVKVMKKVEYTAKILIADSVKDNVEMQWSYTFNGIEKEVKWYVDDELQVELPKKLKEGNRNIRLEIVTDTDEVYTDSKVVSVEHVADLDDPIQGSVPVGTTIYSTAPVNAGPLENVLDTTMYNWWSARGYSAKLEIEFPYPIDISFFEIGHGGTPSCEQTMVMEAYDSNGSKIGDARTLKYTIHDNTGISNEVWAKTPEKYYSCWDDISIKGCKKLTLDINGNRSWVSLRMVGFKYTKAS